VLDRHPDDPYPHRREDHAAAHLLDRFGDRAADRGAPCFLKLRWRPGSARPEASVVARREGLLGVTVGPRWDAVAVVATGRFRLTDDACEPAAAVRHGMGGGLRLACVVSRPGSVGWRLVLPDGTRFDPVPDEGFMLDVLRRSLQLPTPPAPATTGALLLAVWVAVIRAAADQMHHPLGWDLALRLHPALVDGPPLPTPHAEAAVREAAAGARWEAMRLLVAAGMTSPYLPPSRLARWMDDGMFARWVLGSLPPAADLVAAARPHLEPFAWRRLHHLARQVDDRTGVG
jgi:hypothetical protein